MTIYYEAVNSDTEAKFEENRLRLRSLNQALAGYLDLHWWKYKDRVVRFWTNSYHHFGYQDTSAVERTHAQIKEWLKSSRGDLCSISKKLLLWWKRCVLALSLRTEQDATITPHRFQVDRYSAIVRIVTLCARKATDTLWHQAQEIVTKRLPRSSCSGSFRVVHGRPCLHELIAFVESNGRMKLRPDLFNRHWWIPRARDTYIPRIEEPSIISRYSRSRSQRSSHTTSPRANQGVHGTGRAPIFAERMDSNHPAQPPATNPILQAQIEHRQRGTALPSFHATFNGDPSQHGLYEPFEEAFTPARS